MTIPTITPAELARTLQKTAAYDLIDVRTPAEFGCIHADGARLVPLDVLDPRQVMSSRRGAPPDPLYVICKSGNRSRQACQKFVAAGFQNVISVDGGTEAWQQAGLPVVRGQWALPLDRQLQIVIGSLIVIGMSLGTWMNHWWYVLPALVGCGLLTAGLTGFCAMAVLLGRMPWNQRAESSTTCGSR